MLIFSWFMVILFLIIGVVNGITPYYSRLGTPFGVTVPTSHQKDPYVLKLKKAYFYQNVIGSILLAAPIFFFLFWRCIFCLIIFLYRIIQYLSLIHI